MKAVIFICAITLSGCATFYEPVTKEGALCKQQCAQAQLSCAGSSYTCDMAYGNCIGSCKDIDRLSGAPSEK